MTPDISLCVWRSGACVLADTCYRATAEPDEVSQSYFAPSNPGEGCSYFIDATPKGEEKKA